MEWLIVVLCVGVVLGRPGTSKIVGGEEADIVEVPYQLALEGGPIIYTQICGATIIGETTAITAGHCAVGFSANQLRVRAGSTRVSGGSIHKAERIILHEDYSPSPINFDIALIIVSEPFEWGPNIQPAPLATQEPLPGDIAVISGWGITNENGIFPPSSLRKVEIPIVNRTECAADYQAVADVTETMICAGLKGKDSCQGDSGGPLVINGTLYGVVSWGFGCAREGYPGVYTDVAYFSDWIAENLKNGTSSPVEATDFANDITSGTIN